MNQLLLVALILSQFYFSSNVSAKPRTIQQTPIVCDIFGTKNKGDRPDAKLDVFVKIAGLPTSPGGIARQVFVEGQEFSATLTVDEADRAIGLRILDVQMNNKTVLRVEYARNKNHDSYYVYPSGFSVHCQSR